MRPTAVRHRLLAATSLVAVFMYVDRACLGQVTSDIQRELHLEDWQMDWVKGAFFQTYAVAQVFAGVVALRFGLRHTFAVCLFLWSAFTVLTGLAGGFLVLLCARWLVGVAEAGAYPIAASLVRNWFPLTRRGFASSMIALGGRVGGAAGQLLTPALVLAFAAAASDPAAGGWRQTLQLFGYLGMGYAVVYWFLCRDRAADHPRANAAEAALVPVSPAESAKEPFPLRPVLLSRNLWLASATQFGINIGWAFILTSLGDYLEKGHGLTGNDKGVWGSLPLFVGVAGMFAGGFVTDALSKRLGLRWGRALPLGVALAVAAGACGAAAATADYRVVVGLLCLMAVCVDVGVPATWAFAQDVGGRHTGSVLGWANMWGNLGASVSPLLLGAVKRAFAVPNDPLSGWPAAFAACAVSFAVAAACGLQLDAGKKLTGATAAEGGTGPGSR